jgi:integrator complex subunit 7
MYSIIQRLELATDRIELEAAIWAGDQICARSNRFPSVIFSKIADKLESKLMDECMYEIVLTTNI